MGKRFGINPTMTFAIDSATMINLSYEYLDHERYIDRGIPTENGAPVDALKWNYLWYRWKHSYY